LAIYDAAGRLVRELVDEVLPAGQHQAYWDNRDANGRRVASGVYFAHLRSGDRLHAVKMIVLQ
jgi:flagellar hook assembly protein FlgD